MVSLFHLVAQDGGTLCRNKSVKPAKICGVDDFFVTIPKARCRSCVRMHENPKVKVEEPKHESNPG